MKNISFLQNNRMVIHLTVYLTGPDCESHSDQNHGSAYASAGRLNRLIAALEHDPASEGTQLNGALQSNENQNCSAMRVDH